jgi:hypothetical protein
MGTLLIRTVYHGQSWETQEQRRCWQEKRGFWRHPAEWSNVARATGGWEGEMLEQDDLVVVTSGRSTWALKSNVGLVTFVLSTVGRCLGVDAGSSYGFGCKYSAHEIKPGYISIPLLESRLTSRQRNLINIT